MRNDLDILVVDSDEAFRSAMRASVRPGDRLHFLDTLEEAIDLMCLQPVDVVFIDIDFYSAAASFTGSKSGHSCVQIIGVSMSAATAIGSLETGAIDFIIKSLPPESLSASIRSCLHRAAECILHSRLSEFLRRKRDQLDFFTRQSNELTIRDKVTMTFSESYLRQCMSEEIALGASRSVNFSLLLLTVQGCDLFAQTHGVEEANLVLRAIADTLLHRLRKTDVVGRYGGNAFLVLLRGTTAEDVQSLMPGLRERIDSRMRNLFSAAQSLHVAFRLVAVPDDRADLNKLFSQLGEPSLPAAMAGECTNGADDEPKNPDHF